MRNTQTKYVPIVVDFSMPLKHERLKFGKFRMFLMRVRKIMGVYHDFTYENQINEQLKLRESFPREEWEKDFKVVDAIEKILKESVLGRVNHHYILSDLLLYVLLDTIDDDVAHWMLRYIKKSGIGKCSCEEIVAMARKKYTLKEFFIEIMQEKNALKNPGELKVSGNFLG